MPDSYLDVQTDTVASAGRSTADTSSQWAAWASRVETTLRSAAGGASESVVSAALEGYLSAWNPTLQGLATQVAALGTNAASASHVITNADGTATGALADQGSIEQTRASQLSRPITP